jgi:hypothetical protein
VWLWSRRILIRQSGSAQHAPLFRRAHGIATITKHETTQLGVKTKEGRTVDSDLTAKQVRIVSAITSPPAKR